MLDYARIVNPTLIETPDLNYSVLLKNFFPVLFVKDIHDAFKELILGNKYFVRIYSESRWMLNVPMDGFNAKLNRVSRYSLMEDGEHTPIDLAYLSMLTGSIPEKYIDLHIKSFQSYVVDIALFARL